MLGLSAVQSPSEINACSAIQACNGITQIPPTSTPIAQTYAVDLDGVDDYITIPDSADLSFGNGSSDSAFSMSFWVKPNAFPFYVASKTNSTSDREFLLLMNSTTVMEYYLYDVDNNNRIYAQSTGAYATDRWYHIVVTYDGSSNSSGLEIYVDGTLTTTAQGSNGTYVAMHDTAASIDLGAITWLRYDAGRFKEAAIFDYELTSGNVTTLYGGGTMGDTASLDPVGHWRMGDNDGGTGTTITDQGSGSNDATLVNGPTFVEDVPVPVFNRYSVDFDGVDDVIDLDNTDLCRTNFSIVVWAKLAANASVQNLFASDLGTGQPATPYFRFYINNYVLTAKVGSNAGSIIASDTISSGQWYCLAATVSGDGSTSTVKLYVDGNEVDSTTGSHTNIDQTKRTTLGYLFYKISTSTWIWPFEGGLDEVGVWNSVLSSDELTAITNGGVPIDLLTNSGDYSSSSNLAGWWRMGDNDGGTGTTITDQGSGGNNATLTNGPIFSTDVPT